MSIATVTNTLITLYYITPQLPLFCTVRHYTATTTTQHYTTLQHTTLQYTQYTTLITPNHNYNCNDTNLHYITTTTYNYNPTTLQLQLQLQLHHTTSSSCGEVTTATIAITPEKTTPTTCRSISGFALPYVSHNNQPFL